MITHAALAETELRRKIKNLEICFGGNRVLKIYGTLHCSSGKKMQRKNRVFFGSEKEARENGYRPCGHCMKKKYQFWKNGLVQ